MLNGHLSGVGVDLGIMSLNLNFEDWHINTSVEINIFGYTTGVKDSLGFSKEDDVDFNIALGWGHKDDNSSNVNYYGLKISSDLTDGILGGYHQYIESTQTDNVENIRQTEVGFQVGNWKEVAAVGVVVAVAVALEVGFLIPAFA